MCLVTSIISICAGNIGSVNHYIDCHTEYKGIFSYWENIDSLFYYIDMTLCSSKCPCNITTDMQSAFKADDRSKEFIHNWIMNGNNTSFQHCPSNTIDNVITYYESQEEVAHGKLKHLDIKKFIVYWKYIEERFNCVGWCANSYWYTGNFSERYVNGGFYKYLFSGVNRGIPEYAGCLKVMFNYIKPKILLCGYIGLFASILMLSSWIVSLMMYIKIKNSFIINTDIQNTKKMNSKNKYKDNISNNNNIKHKKNKLKKTKTNRIYTDDMKSNTQQGTISSLKIYTEVNTDRKFNKDYIINTSDTPKSKHYKYKQ